MKISFLATLCCAFVAIHCAAPSGAVTQSQQAETLANKTLVVPKNAEKIKTNAGGNAVSFELREPYPAERFRLALENAYMPPQWQKEDELRLFPGRKTSESPGGWFRYLEGDQMVYMWAVNWVDKNENSVTYAVRYRFPERATPSGGRAAVDAVFQPSK